MEYVVGKIVNNYVHLILIEMTEMYPLVQRAIVHGCW